MPPHSINVRKQLELHFATATRESSKSLSRYFDHVVLDTRPEPKRFQDVGEDWQRARNAILTPALEQIAGLRSEYIGPRCFWFEMTRGTDKTGTVGRILNWLLSYSKNHLELLACAADKDQAGLVKGSMETEHRLNAKWLPELNFKNNEVTGPGGRLQILASDGDTNQGLKFDVMVADEISIWQKPDLWDAVSSTIVKRGGYAILIVISNSGFLNSWQWHLREKIRKRAEMPNPDWYFYAQPLDTALASWMTPEAVAAACELISDTEARRLFGNHWIDPSEANGYLTAEEVQRCVGTPLPAPPGATNYLGVDFGARKDRCVFTRLWYDTSTGIIHVNDMECIQGSAENEVQVETVDDWLDANLKLFPNATVVLDLHQLLATAQKLERRGVKVKRFEYRAGKGNAKMTANLRLLVKNQRLCFTADCGRLGDETLATEMAGLITKRMVYGERFDHLANSHDDRVTAVGMAALQAVTDTAGPTAIVPTPPPNPFQPPLPTPHARLGDLTRARERGLFGMRQ